MVSLNADTKPSESLRLIVSGIGSGGVTRRRGFDQAGQFFYGLVLMHGPLPGFVDKRIFALDLLGKPNPIASKERDLPWLNLNSLKAPWIYWFCAS